MDIAKLINTYPLISEQVDQHELFVILRELQRTLRTEQGVVVEFGCFTGTTSLFIQRLLAAEFPEREYHVYDSFAGLPPKTDPDHSPAGEQFIEGTLHSSKKEFINNFKKAGLKLPIIHKAWFSDLTSNDIPGTIAYAFLDGDYYQSIKDSLQHIAPQLTPNATIVVDDYQSESLPGAKKAVDEWKTRHPYECRVEASLAILRRSS